MYISRPQDTLRVVADNDYILEMHRRHAVNFLANTKAKPTTAAYKAVADYMSEACGVRFTVAKTKEILTLYPQERIALAMQGVWGVDDRFADVLAHHYLGCSWPTYGDNVDMTAFVALLQRQIAAVDQSRAA